MEQVLEFKQILLYYYDFLQRQNVSWCLFVGIRISFYISFFSHITLYIMNIQVRLLHPLDKLSGLFFIKLLIS